MTTKKRGRKVTTGNRAGSGVTDSIGSASVCRHVENSKSRFSKKNPPDRGGVQGVVRESAAGVPRPEEMEHIAVRPDRLA